MAVNDQVGRAAQVYICGYPPVYCLDEIHKVVTGAGVVTSDGFNSFGAPQQLLGPDAKFVTLNNDTLDLIGACRERSRVRVG